MTARTALSADTCAAASAISSWTWALSAFIFGRSSLMVAIPSADSTRTNSPTPATSTPRPPANPRHPQATALPAGSSGRQDAVQYQVDDVVDELVVERGVAVQQPVVERPVEQVDRHLDVRIGRDLAAFDGAAEDGSGLVPTRLDQTPLVLGREGRVGPSLHQQRGHHPAVRPAAGQPAPREQQREQINAERAALVLLR